MFELDEQEYMKCKPEDIIRRLRPVPGPKGLATLFHAIKLAEDRVNLGHSQLLSGMDIIFNN